MVLQALFATLFFLSSSLAIVANPAVVKRSPRTLPLTKRFNPSSKLIIGAKTEARNFAIGSRDDTISIPFIQTAFIFTANICIRTCAVNYTVMLDIGKGNTWIGAGNHALPESTPTNQSVTVQYNFGNFTGVEYTDKVILGPFTIEEQSFGVARNSTGFEGIDGILGLGPVGLTKGTLYPDTNVTVPTVTDNLFSEGLISTDLYAISFVPTDATQFANATQVANVSQFANATRFSSVDWNGEISWGEVDGSKYTGYIHYTNIISIPAANSWGIICQSTSYGSTPILGLTLGTIDTSLSRLYIASDAYEIYKRATGALVDKDTNMLIITKEQLENLKSLFITIDGVTLEITADAQVYPRGNNRLLGGSPEKIYLAVGSLPGISSPGQLSFVLGQPFLERYYFIYYNTGGKIGLAASPFKDLIINTFGTFGEETNTVDVMT